MRYGSEFRDSEYCGMDSLFLPLQIGSCTNNIGTNRLRLSGLCPGSSSKTSLSSNHTGYVKQPSDIEFMLKKVVLGICPERKPEYLPGRVESTLWKIF